MIEIHMRKKSLEDKVKKQDSRIIGILEALPDDWFRLSSAEEDKINRANYAAKESKEYPTLMRFKSQYGLNREIYQ
jgi:hypothetical protein